MEEIKLTEKGMQVLKALQEAHINKEEDAVFSKRVAELAFMMPNGVPGVLTSLNKKGLVDKTADTPRKYFLTEQGVNFNLQ